MPAPRNHAAGRVWAIASLGVLVFGFGAASGSAKQHSAATAVKAGAPPCRGKARHLRPGRVSFSFRCGSEDVTAFDLQANRTLHSMYDPSYAFGCQRRTSRSFFCEDIHSGAGPIGSGVAAVSEPLCPHGAHLILRITPALNFEARSLPALTLGGPC